MTQSSKQITTVGVASGLGGLTHPCTAPDVLKHSSCHQWLQQQLLSLHWQDILRPEPLLTSLEAIGELNERLARTTAQLTADGEQFLVLGGDHSCAMGTWAGVLNALDDQQRLGLLWLDAHLDANTFQTSATGKVHGMPVAALLGHGDESLNSCFPSHRYLQAEQLALAGIRNYESEEQHLLQRSEVKVWYLPISTRQQVQLMLDEALQHLSLHCDVLGISIDMDCLNPEHAPGVDTPAENGISPDNLVHALTYCHWDKPLVGVEICEFVPEKDQAMATERTVFELIHAIFSNT